MQTTLFKIYTSFLLGSANNYNIIDWAINTLQINKENELSELLLSIASINRKDKRQVSTAGEILTQIIKEHYPDFENFKEQLAMELLRDKCQDLLNKKIKPHELCCLVGPIETIFDYPTWLGDLYNACDWCEPDTLPEEHLLLEAKKILQNINKELN